jgi:hypothetical protein
MTRLGHASLAAIMAATLVSGCGTVPTELATPTQVTCMFLKEPISHYGKYGLLNVPWETRLERGPYASEREDDKGTYYRAPPGGVRVTIGYNVETHDGGYVKTRDGGIYVPNNPKEAPSIYEYFSVENASAQVPPADMDCSSVGYIKDPSTSKISLVEAAAGGAGGGALGGVIGRAVGGHGMSYGHAAGVGAAGGLIGGLIVAGIVNANVGRIMPGPTLQDPAFVEKLRELAASGVPVKQLPPEAATPQQDQRLAP